MYKTQHHDLHQATIRELKLYQLTRDGYIKEYRSPTDEQQQDVRTDAQQILRISKEESGGAFAGTHGDVEDHHGLRYGEMLLPRESPGEGKLSGEVNSVYAER